MLERIQDYMLPGKRCHYFITMTRVVSRHFSSRMTNSLLKNPVLCSLLKKAQILGTRK